MMLLLFVTLLYLLSSCVSSISHVDHDDVVSVDIEAKQQQPELYVPKIAFIFLVANTPNFEHLWSDFFTAAVQTEKQNPSLLRKFEVKYNKTELQDRMRSTSDKWKHRKYKTESEAKRTVLKHPICPKNAWFSAREKYKLANATHFPVYHSLKISRRGKKRVGRRATIYLHPSRPGQLKSQAEAQIDIDRIQKSLRWPFKGTVASPALCKWGRTNPCMARGLQAAYDDDVANEWFVFVSGSTLPTKNFDWMYDELTFNPRSRFFFSRLEFGAQLPKINQWIILNRRHASILLEHADEWVLPPLWANGFAADDEIHAGFTLLRSLGPEAFFAQVNDGLNPYLDYAEYQRNLMSLGAFDLKSDMVEKREILRKAQLFTYVCWKANGCGLGQRRRGSGLPATFSSVFDTEFEDRLLHPDSPVWFARKFKKSTVVKHNSTETIGTPLEEWLRNTLRGKKIYSN